MFPGVLKNGWKKGLSVILVPFLFYDHFSSTAISSYSLFIIRFSVYVLSNLEDKIQDENCKCALVYCIKIHHYFTQNNYIIIVFLGEGYYVDFTCMEGKILLPAWEESSEVESG